MFRAEQMASLPGTVALTPEGEGPRSIVNEPGGRPQRRLGGRGPGPGRRAIRSGSAGSPPGPGCRWGRSTPRTCRTRRPVAQLEPGPFLNLLRKASVATRLEEVGELRLIAWADKPLAGQAIDPPVDRQRGFTLVVAHLQPAPLLGPGLPRYNALAEGAERPVNPYQNVLQPIGNNTPNGRRGGRGGAGTMPGANGAPHAHPRQPGPPRASDAQSPVGRRPPSRCGPDPGPPPRSTAPETPRP